MGGDPAHAGQRFEIRARLGAGGMGVVYRARDRERDAEVALKRLSHTDPAAVARFKREFRALADVVHPNLVQLYELIASEDQLFFTMELVRGVDFIEWVRPDRDEPTLPSQTTVTEIDARPAGDTDTLTPATSVGAGPAAGRPEPAPASGGDPARGLRVDRLRDAMAQLAQGVAAIHDAGLLHRDLKPSNVIVTRDGRVVILDFGIATDRAQEITVTVMNDRVVGTPHYMAPEQAAGRAASAASDWYAVGAILYVALTGTKPHHGPRAEILRDKQRFEPPPPQLIAPSAPADLAALCQDLLRIAPDARPDRREVLARLGVAANGAPSLARKRSPTEGGRRLIGRGEQLSAIDDAMAETRAGRPVVARVSGRSGMGKTALLRASLRRLRREGATVLRGRCYQRESVPFKALDSLVDSLATRLRTLTDEELPALVPKHAWSLARMFPVLRRVNEFEGMDFLETIEADAQESRRRAAGAFRDLLRSMAERGPLVLAIDDLQWGDVDSAELLAELVRPPYAPAILLIASYRSEDEETSAFLCELIGRCADAGVDMRAIEVGPLPDESARELALEHLGDGPAADALAGRIADESRGSPFFVEELARHAAEHAAATRSDVISLDDVLQRRLAGLPPQARRLLTTVAVAARPLLDRVAARAAEVDDPGALQFLTAGSFAIHKSTADGDYLECYHDRLREAATSSLTAAELRAHHARLAAVLESEDAFDAEELAQYLHGAGDDARAATLAARAAAGAAATLAFDRAVRLYQWALELDPNPGDRLALLTALGDALLNGRRGAEAAEVYLRAAEEAPPRDNLELRRRASHQLLNAGQIDRGRAILDEVLASCDMRLPSTKGRGIAALLWHRMRLSLRGLGYSERDAGELNADRLMQLDAIYAAAEGLGMVQPIFGAVAQARHLRMALDAGEPTRISQALAAEIAYVSRAGSAATKRTARAQALLDGIAGRSDDPFVQVQAHGAATIGAFQEGRFLDAHTHAEKTIELLETECVGRAFEIGTLESFRIMNKMALGQLREVAALTRRRVREALERNDLFTATNIGACTGFWSGLMDDDPERAHADIDEAIGLWRADGFHLQHMQAINAHALVDLYAGDGVSALERFERAWPDYKRAFLLTAQVVRANVLSWRGRAALVAAETEPDSARYLRMARKDARRLRREGVEYAAMYDVALRAGIARLRGDVDAALALLAETERLAERTGMRFFARSCWRVRGELLGGDEGSGLIARADAAFAAEDLSNPARAAAFGMPGFAKRRLER